MFFSCEYQKEPALTTTYKMFANVIWKSYLNIFQFHSLFIRDYYNSLALHAKYFSSFSTASLIQLQAFFRKYLIKPGISPVYNFSKVKRQLPHSMYQSKNNKKGRCANVSKVMNKTCFYVRFKYGKY